jgi:hypothetical protein
MAAMPTFSDPRGPRRTITAAQFVQGGLPEHIGTGDAWVLTLDCGHTSYGVPHSWYQVGTHHHCLTCRNAQ